VSECRPGGCTVQPWRQRRESNPAKRRITARNPAAV